MDRRQFLRRASLASVAAVPALTVGYTLVVEPHWLDITRRPMPIADLPSALRGRTLAQVSDMHVGTRVDDDYLIASLERLAALKPDIVAYTGDFISHDPTRGNAQYAQLARVLRHAPQATLGSVAVLGNHDYGVDWREARVAERVAATVEAAGIRVLRNDVAALGGLEVVGIDDLWALHADSRGALARRSGKAAIALCHNPDGLDDLPWEGYEGWVLAGHTHGGQCKPPFLPPPLLPVRNRRYTSGSIDAGGGRQLYINRGLGHLTKARFNVRPEITLFEMNRGGQE